MVKLPRQRFTVWSWTSNSTWVMTMVVFAFHLFIWKVYMKSILVILQGVIFAFHLYIWKASVTLIIWNLNLRWNAKSGKKCKCKNLICLPKEMHQKQNYTLIKLKAKRTLDILSIYVCIEGINKAKMHWALFSICLQDNKRTSREW